MECKKYITLILFFLSLSPVFSQITKVSGIVLQQEDSLPAFASVVFKEDSLNGDNVDLKDGKFTLTSKKNVTAIIVRGTGYKPVEYKIEYGKNNKDILIYMEPDVNEIPVFTVKPKRNPAEVLIDSVIARRKYTDFRRAGSFYVNTYEKTTLSIYNVPEKLKKSVLLRPIKEVFDNPDTVDGVVMYPAMMAESFTDMYKKKGQLESKYQWGSKISGIENDILDLGSLTTTLFQDFNVYDDYQNVLGKIFMGPINPIGTTYYDYRITDTMTIKGRRSFKVELRPKLFTELIYTGSLWISDTTYAVMEADLKMDKNANINLFTNLQIQADYKKLENDPTHFVLEDERIRLDVNPTDFISFTMNLGPKNNKFLISAVKSTHFTGYELDQKPPKQIPPMGTVEVADTIKHNEAWWVAHRPYALDSVGKKIYTTAELIKRKPIVRFLVKVGDVFGSGYANFDYVAIGPLYEIYSRNDIEGDRIKMGVRTGDSLSRRFIAEGFVAYGFGDKKWKWQAFANFHFTKDKKPWRMITVMGRQGIEQIGLNPGQFRPDNVVGTFLRRRTLRTLSYINQVQIVYDHDWFQGFNQKLTVDWQQIYPTKTLPFPTLDNNGVVSGYLPSYTRFEIRLETTLALGQRQLTGRTKRRTLRGKWPEIKFTYAIGIKGVLGSDYNYHMIRLNIKDIIRIKPLGYGEYVLQAGKVFGQVPYPILEIHPGNDTYSYDKYAFNCMNYFEFVSDQFVSFSYEHHFEGFFFNKIPGFNKLKWREIVGIRGVWGSLSAQNRSYIALPPGTYDLRDQLTGKYVPYMEMNVGIENIFNIIRIDFVYRLTHRKQADPNNPGSMLYNDSFNWGIFGGFSFDF
jgi:hypothetical protein